MSFISTYFSPTIVMASIAALGFGFISPVQPAEAAQLPSDPSVTSSPYDSLTVNLDINRSHDFLGDSKDVHITVRKKSDAILPEIPKGDYHYAHLYDLTTGQYIVSKEMTAKSDSVNLNLIKFADVGMHEYRVFLTREESYSPKPPEHLDDFIWWAGYNLIGASNIVEWERKPLKLTLETSDPNFALLGSSLTYKLNQEINGKDYAVTLYNIATGQIGAKDGNSQSYTKEYKELGVKFPYGRPNQFQAVLTKQNYDGIRYSPVPSFADMSETKAYSNLVTLRRSPWKVETYLSGEELGVYIYRGGGEYGAYVVERSTGEVVDYTRSNARTLFDNRGHGKDVSWAKVYVARAFDEATSDGPQNVSELEDIIADSDGLVDDVNGIQKAKELAGGRNLNEVCNVECHGDPINAATGEFFENKTDITTIGGGLVPTLQRSFSTLNKDSVSLLGYGWKTNYEMKLYSDPENAEAFGYDPNILTSRFLAIENENGSISSFYRKEDGTFKGKTSTLATLEFNSMNNTFELERQTTKETFVFNSSGKLIQIRNQNTSINLAYESDTLTEVSDSSGNSLTFSYTASNLISAITAQNGKKVSYAYNSSKQLIKTIDESGTTYAYTYDSSRRVKTLTNELGGITSNTYNSSNQVTTQTDPLGRALTFTYQGTLNSTSVTKISYPNGKIVEETYYAGNLLKRVEKVENNIRTWIHSYDGNGQMSSTIFPDSTSESFLYDDRGNLIKYIDQNRNITVFIYDSLDNLISSKNALGDETVNTYDEKNNLVSTTAPSGERTAFAYNGAGMLEGVTDARGNAFDADPTAYSSTYGYLPNGLLTSATDAGQGQTAMSYDSLGNMVKTTNARGFETNVTYTEAGLPATIFDPLNNQTAITYDKMGNILTSKNATNAVTSYTYDSLGNMLTMTDANGGVTGYTYDVMNNPVSITLPDGTVQNITYNGFGEVTEVKDQLGRTTKQEWDSVGNLKASVDADGGRTDYTYDPAKNLIAEKTPTGAVTKAEYDKLNQLVKTTDGLGRVTEIAYDANGRMVEVKSPDKTSTKNVYDRVGNIVKTIDEKGGEKTYSYDSLNRKVAYTNELGKITTYAYDGMSNLASETRPDGSMVSYEYDARDLLTKVDYEGTADDVTYSYDAIGRKVSETKGAGATVEYTYDSLNRILSSGVEGSKVAYEYDIVGNIKTMTYPSGRIVNYRYDAASQAASVSSNGIPSTSLYYNNRGLPTSTVLPNGITEKKEYDLDGKLASTDLTNAASTSLYKKTQKYNQAGEVIQKGVFVNGSNVTLDNFTYDPASRLTQQETDETKETVNEYGYSPIGSLNTVNGKVQNYDEAGKLLGAGAAELTYDARNNRTGFTDSADVSKNAEYSWEENNTLSGITTHKENVPDATSYEYSADKLLASRTSDGVTQKFVWDTNRIIPVMLSDGKYEYLYKGQSERVPFAQVELSTGFVTYLHSDLTGSVTASTSASGELLGTVDYSPYGEATGPLLSAFGYAGEWVDNITGYTYLRMRWLDTTTGVFLSEDPLVQATNNAFGYAEGNPITQIDPLGLFINSIAFSQAIYQTDWKEAGLNVLRNSGNLSAGFGFAGISTAATGGGALIAPVFGVTSLVFGAGAFIYDLGNCVGYLDDAACNPGFIALDVLGLTTGGAAQVIGRFGKLGNLSSATMTHQLALDNTSFVAGFTGAAIGAAKSLDNKEKNTTKEAAGKCDTTPKKSSLILL